MLSRLQNVLDLFYNYHDALGHFQMENKMIIWGSIKHKK